KRSDCVSGNAQIAERDANFHLAKTAHLQAQRAVSVSGRGNGAEAFYRTVVGTNGNYRPEHANLLWRRCTLQGNTARCIPRRRAIALFSFEQELANDTKLQQVLAAHILSNCESSKLPQIEATARKTRFSSLNRRCACHHAGPLFKGRCHHDPDEKSPQSHFSDQCHRYCNMYATARGGAYHCLGRSAERTSSWRRPNRAMGRLEFRHPVWSLRPSIWFEI